MSEDTRFARLEAIMERGFETLADLQRATNHRLDGTNQRLDVLTERVDVLTERVDVLTERVDTLTERVDTLTARVAVIETVLTDLAGQLLTQGRLLRILADKHEANMDDLRRRLEAVEKRLGPH